MARLVLCYHGNKDWGGTASTEEWERRRRVHLQSPTSSRNPEGNLEGEMKRQGSIPNFLFHTAVFVLQHQHWPVLLPLLLLSPPSAPLSRPPLSLFVPNSLFPSIVVISTFSPSFYPVFLVSPLLLLACPSLLVHLLPEWISDDSGLVHSGEAEL